MKKFLLTAICFVVCFSACKSMQDISITNHRSETDQKLAELEAAIVPLEALGANEARGRQAELTAIRQMIAQKEREAAGDADYSGKLSAWSGRLAILEGRYSEAQRLHRLSHSTSPGNLPSVILSIRLEGDPLKRMELIERELSLINPRGLGIGELNIERGRALFDMNRFSEAVGAFDIAFAAGLEKVYNDTYKTQRDRAWELRNTSGVAASSLGLLGRETMTWNDCISLANNETHLLRFITGGRSLSAADFFNRLADRGFIPAVQDITLSAWPSARPRADETVTRAGAAWFIWHLYAESRADRSLLSRYSTRFATGANPRSPIADVPALSPFFDSILGCVETELMSLIDGRNFRPSQPMRGTELLAILQRIDR